jgi:hypothetical protein
MRVKEAKLVSASFIALHCNEITVARKIWTGGVSSVHKNK